MATKGDLGNTSWLYNVKIENLKKSVKGIDNLRIKFDQLTNSAKKLKTTIDATLLKRLVQEQKMALQIEKAKQKVLQEQARTLQRTQQAQAAINRAKEMETRAGTQQLRQGTEALRQEKMRLDIERKRQLVQQRAASAARNQRVGGVAGIFARKTGGVLAGYAATFFSIQQGLFLTREIINLNAKVSDLMVDVQRTAELTKTEVNDLVDSLKLIDTRTSLQGLLEIAKIGGQMGIAKDQLAGFTREVDRLNVVLSDEIPGGAEAIATAVGKIGEIFGVFDQYGVPEGLNKIGSLIVRIGQVGLATGGYLQDFAQRVAGTASTLGLSLPKIIAYGAVLEETGVTAEVAGTAMSKLFTFLATRREEFFNIARLADVNLTLEQFTDIINNDASKAIDMFFAGIAKGGKNVTDFFDLITKGIGQKGQRMTEAISKVAQNQELLNERIEQANEAYSSGTAIAEQFALKNENLGAAVDKLHHALQNLVTDPDSNLGNFLKGTIEEITGFIHSLDLMIEGIDRLWFSTQPFSNYGGLTDKEKREQRLRGFVGLSEEDQKAELERIKNQIGKKENAELLYQYLLSAFKSQQTSEDEALKKFLAKSRKDRREYLTNLAKVTIPSNVNERKEIEEQQKLLKLENGGAIPIWGDEGRDYQRLTKRRAELATEFNKLMRLSRVLNQHLSDPIYKPDETEGADNQPATPEELEKLAKKHRQYISDRLSELQDAEENELNLLEVSFLQKNISEEEYYKKKAAIISDWETKILNFLESEHLKQDKRYSDHLLKREKATKDSFDRIYKMQLDDVMKDAAKRNSAISLTAGPGANASPSERAAFAYSQSLKQLEADKQTLAQLEALQKQYADFTIEQLARIKVAVMKGNEEILQNYNELNSALNEKGFGIINSAFDEQRVNLNLKQQQEIDKLLDDKAMSEIKRQKLLREKRREFDAEQFAIDADEAKEELALNEALMYAGLISEEQYLNRKLELYEKYNNAREKQHRKELQNERVQQRAMDDLRNEIMDTVSMMVDTQVALYNQRTQEQHDAAVEELNIETERKLRLATSQQEYDRIQEQAEEKKRALDEKKRQQDQRAAVAQATMQFATASFEIWSRYGTKVLTLPIAVAMQALLAAQYGMTLTKLNKLKQFAHGGEVPSDGGEFGGQPHSRGGTDFSFHGQNFNAEAKELAIINKKSSQDRRAYTVSGTPKQIASALNVLGGGVSFANGAKLTRFAEGGMIGGSFSAPNISGTSISGVQQINEEITSMKESINDLAAIVAEESAKKVYVVQKDIDNAHAKRTRLSNLAKV